MLSLVLGTADLPKLKEKIVSVADRLSRKVSIPQVQYRMETIILVQQDEFWEELSISKLERMRIELRELLRFLDKTERPLAYTNFEDEIGDTVEPVFSYQHLNLDQYRKRVERYIREHKDHLVIDKLYKGEPITQAEIRYLEDHLFQQGELVSKEQFTKAYGNEPLLKFIRRIIGLDVNTAKKYFGEFLAMGHLNSRQIRFIDTIINFLSVNGTIDQEKLFEPPFTDIDSGGILSLFDKEESEKIKKIIQEVNEVG
jgi:type I restriction enzyme R subunit